MSKYLAVVSNSVKKSLVYRANTFIMVVSTFFSFVVLFYFWSSIYGQGNKIGTYTLAEIISYYIFLTIFELLVMGDGTAWSIGDEIKSGQITSSILRPIKYLEYKFSQSIGSLLFRLMIFSLPIIGALLLLRDYLVAPGSLMVYAFFALGAIMSYALYFLVFYIVGLISFWTGDSYGFFFAAFVVINFMQGGLFPLDLLPKWFLMVGNFLPFKYLFFVPVGIVTGRLVFDYTFVLIPVLWCVALYFIANLLYKKGLKKYEGYGI
ncbi:MAG: ABC-2 family transporter protein [bacterium]